MILGFTQSLTEMSARNLPGGIGSADDVATICDLKV
jgi:hypothetical protein